MTCHIKVNTAPVENTKSQELVKPNKAELKKHYVKVFETYYLKSNLIFIIETKRKIKKIIPYHKTSFKILNKVYANAYWVWFKNLANLEQFKVLRKKYLDEEISENEYSLILNNVEFHCFDPFIIGNNSEGAIL